MANERADIETLIAAALAPLKTTGTLKSVVAVGGMDYEAALASVAKSPPYAVIKYTGKDGELLGGGIHNFTARVSVVIGATHFGGKDARRLRVYDVLEAVEDVLAATVLAAGYKPAALVGEEFVDIDPTSAVEAWQQVYAVRFEKA